MSIIKFKDFNFRYDSLKNPTLKNINLDIEEGEKVLIAGPSGSGKSTLAHCLNGLIPFSYKGEITGELTIKGIKPNEKSIYEISDHIGTILQDQDGQFVALSVGEDVAFAYENNRRSSDKMFSGVRQALEAVDMLDYINETPHNLSGGQKQRVSLAGILATETDILLFDEPLANLDPASGSRAMEIIDRIHNETKKTIIIIEHRIEDVLQHHVDRMIIMNDGEIIANAHPDQLLATNTISSYGLREPLYIEALKMAGIDINIEDKISDIEKSRVYSSQIKQLAVKIKDEKVIQETREKLLELEDIHFRYFKETPYILSNINFFIRKGEMVGLLGNNGAGKSTLLKVVSGIVKHQKGNIYYNGENINNWTVRKRAEKIGYVMQNPNHMIIKEMIYDEVAFGLRNHKIEEHVIKEKVYDTLKICGLYAYRKWPVSALSFGQKKRLTIASILAMDPEIIILDEPTAGQDYRNYQEFMSFLKKIKQKGISIILITHDMYLALEYADRSIVLSDGEVIAENSTNRILSNKDIIKKANLKETSLTKLARICGIQDVEGFINNYINQKRR